MRLSVAMCTYNGGAYLREQLESLARQTRPPDELVVCDDGSCDGTRGIVEAFAAEVSFPVRLHVNEKNLGSTKNFEQAISLCAGEVIALADQDDVWLPEKLRRVEAVFASAPNVGLVFTNLEVVDEQLRPLGYRAWECEGVEFDRRAQRAVKRGRALDLLLTRNVVTGCATAFRAGFASLIVPIPHVRRGAGSSADVIHDYWVALIVAAVAEVAFIDEPLVQYRQHSNQQVGLTTPALAGAGRLSKSWRRMGLYQARSFLVDLICERLLSAGNGTKYVREVAELNGRKAHLQLKASLHERKFLDRSVRVIEELFALRYHRYSHPDASGLLEAARDILPYRILLLDPRLRNKPAPNSGLNKSSPGAE